MGTTPTFQLPYPEPTEPADVQLDIKELAQRVDAMLSQVSVTALPIGTPIPWLVAAMPAGYREFDGSAIVQGTHPLLFALFGAVIPDLRDRVLLGASSGKPIGSIGGADAVQLALDEMPRHSHVVNSHSHGGGNHDHGVLTGTEVNNIGQGQDHTHSGGTSTDGYHAHAGFSGQNFAHSAIKEAATGTAKYSVTGNMGGTDGAGSHAHTFGTSGRSNAHHHVITPQTVISAEAPGTTHRGGLGSLSVDAPGDWHDNLQPYRTVRWITVAA